MYTYKQCAYYQHYLASLSFVKALHNTDRILAISNNQLGDRISCYYGKYVNHEGLAHVGLMIAGLTTANPFQSYLGNTGQGGGFYSGLFNVP